MASCTYRSGRNCGQERSRTDAILVQGRQAAQRLLANAVPAAPTKCAGEQEPMRRYIHPIPCRAAAAFPADAQACLEQITQLLTTQNQLLIDLLGAVNSLTAASLSAQHRT
jgi:hypothetical protein